MISAQHPAALFWALVGSRGDRSMPVIDADAHVHECDRTWEFMEGDDRKYKPSVVASIDPAEKREYWLIDGRVRGRGFGNVGAATPKAYRELSDIPGRLRHMD